jgi:hypothetical protein
MVVLDYWNHGCISCIRDFERLDSLQTIYRDRLQIILICRESRDSTLKFFAKRKKLSIFSLPLVTNGWELWSKFTHDRSPRQVWIDTAGCYQYLTGSKNLQPASITAFLEKKSLPIINYALLTGNRAAIETEQQPIFYSALSRRDPGEKGQWTINQSVNNGASLRTLITGSSIFRLYKFAYEEKGKHDFSGKHQWDLDVEDTFKYIKPEDPLLHDLWEQEHSYRYELVIPFEKKTEVFEYIRRDLDRYFGLKVVVEKRRIPVYLLVQTSNENKAATKGGSFRNDLSGYTLKSVNTDSLLYIRNIPVESLVNFFDDRLCYWLGERLIDRSCLKGNLDLEFRSDSYLPFNIEEIRKDLKEFGLDFIRGEEWMDVLVLKE